jgi:hypothetical protein
MSTINNQQSTTYHTNVMSEKKGGFSPPPTLSSNDSMDRYTPKGIERSNHHHHHSTPIIRALCLLTHNTFPFHLLYSTTMFKHGTNKKRRTSWSYWKNQTQGETPIQEFKSSFVAKNKSHIGRSPFMNLLESNLSTMGPEPCCSPVAVAESSE